MWALKEGAREGTHRYRNKHNYIAVNSTLFTVYRFNLFFKTSKRRCIQESQSRVTRCTSFSFFIWNPRTSRIFFLLLPFIFITVALFGSVYDFYECTVLRAVLLLDCEVFATEKDRYGLSNRNFIQIFMDKFHLKTT